MGGLSEDVLRARAYLNRVSEPADRALWRFVQREGPVVAAAAIRSGRAPDLVLVASSARRAATDPGLDLDAAERHGLRLVAPESDDWPHFAMAALDQLAARPGSDHRGESGESVPPLALWVKGPGDLAGLGVRGAAIVGARAATPYGEHVTTDLAYGLARQEVTIVSGGAYGIDAAAHRAALAAGGATVVVSAGGLDQPYPSGNATLFEQVAAEGLLIAESPPGCSPQRHRFLTRNRLIAALSSGVVVVEAAARSGATNTANHAVVQGRPVMAVPGPVTSAMSVGCHDLLRRDDRPALLITGVADVLAVVGSIGEGLSASVDAGGAASDSGDDLRTRLDGLDAIGRRVFDGLRARRFSRPEEIAVRSGVAPLQVLRALPGLELAGLVEVQDGGYRVAGR